MNFDSNIHAELVWDGGDVHVPERLGKPTANQLQGTPLEQLAELAGRVCYDSLGKGRASAEYHAHIRDVNHLSVYEHCVFTVYISPPFVDVPIHELLTLFNRPGVHVRYCGGSIRVTLNLRAVLEFTSHDGACLAPLDAMSTLHASILNAVLSNAPTVLRDVERGLGWTSNVTMPETDDEQWITLLLCGSRGLSHELVRHGDNTAISQRSTRYVDESSSPWVQHPLIEMYTAEDRTQQDPLGFPKDSLGTLEHDARGVYDDAVRRLQGWLATRGVDAGIARKQARGAARGFLGNALYTEVIFSASVRQWRHMLRMRCSPHADAEIRVLFARALGELKRSRYGGSFVDMHLVPAADGIGEVLA